MLFTCDLVVHSLKPGVWYGNFNPVRTGS